MSDSACNARNWGANRREREQEYPCARHVPDPKDSYHRAIYVQADAPLLFRWLCQLRAAPYSYDWIDNFGRRSPRRLTPGLDRPEVGQSFMTIFELVEFETDRSLTLHARRMRALFGDVAVTYLIAPSAVGSCRLVLNVVLRSPSIPGLSSLHRAAMPWLDLLMSRKQLLTLKRLAEGEAARRASLMHARA